MISGNIRRAALGVAGVVLVAAGVRAQSAARVSDGVTYTSSGAVVRPADYREWVYLTSGLGMSYAPEAQATAAAAAAAGQPRPPVFDNVFVNPSSYRAFLETGRWPDKTMFILEVRRSAGKGSINNGGHYQVEVAAIEAAVKDEARFPQKWSYFGFGKTDRATALPATSSCNNCHRQNAAVENTFVQFYPTLLDVAKAKGTLNPSFSERH